MVFKLNTRIAGYIRMVDTDNAPNTVRREKGKSTLVCVNDYIAIDIETTGLDSVIDDIIELAAIKYHDGTPIDTFHSLIKPQCEISAFITELTGITNDMVSSAPCISEILPSFLSFIDKNIVIAHNANFDINFIYDVCKITLGQPVRNDFVDTLRLSRNLFPDGKHRLIDLVQRFELGDTVNHRAVGDAQQAAACYEYMKKYMRENNISSEFLLDRSRQVRAKHINTNNTDFDTSSPIFNNVFVFTGVLDKMPRRKAMQLVADFGGICGDSVTKATNFLVLGCNDYCNAIKDGKSAKHKKAEKLKLAGQDINIISENVFYDMVSCASSD